MKKSLILSLVLSAFGFTGLASAQTPEQLAEMAKHMPPTIKVAIVEAPKDATSDSVVSEVKPGKLMSAGSAGVGKAAVVSTFTLGFGGTADVRYEAYGDTADVVVGRKIQEIRLKEYDPKTMGGYGEMTLMRFGVADGKRFLRLAADGTQKPNKMHLKDLPKVKLTKDVKGWFLQITGEFTPGNYVVMAPLNISAYYDFDVK